MAIEIVDLHGFTHWNWWFSIAMLNYQRVKTRHVIGNIHFHDPWTSLFRAQKMLHFEKFEISTNWKMWIVYIYMILEYLGYTNPRIKDWVKYKEDAGETCGLSVLTVMSCR